ncbi:MAG TPA: ADP-ribosylglycohydrolase family protein [Thermotogota bacterium]|nr:ADP-ribosylglycohydrolase family protein [Thermotogota bacterium]
MNYGYDYLEKVYAGLLGKVIGVRLGAPIEPLFWTAEKIREVFGEISGYVKEYKNFAADDDINGPIFFIRAIEDAYRETGTLDAADIGDAWLNYSAEGHGMFWWGGYGTSTEHTAYTHLMKGVKPPLSGSVQLNGTTVAEQIGGQIFIDTWGLICPGNPEEAARLAGMAASVSHDLNGRYGASYVAACIAMAFEEAEIDKIVLECRKYIPEDSEYKLMIDDVYDFYTKHPENWREALEYVNGKYTKEKYPGVVHIIPNSAYMIISMLYGKGDFSRTLEIAVMCGWDTDCNAGNVGTIMGVAKGLNSIEEKWRRPINDFVAASSVIGCLNINDLPTLTKQIATYGALYNRVEPDESFRDCDHVKYDFQLPGSTHAMRTYPENIAVVSNRNSLEPELPGALRVRMNFMRRNTEARVFMKPFYRRKDFDDERYIPNFSPIAFAGQTMKLSVMTKDLIGIHEIIVKPYVQDTEGKQYVSEHTWKLQNGQTEMITYQIPDGLEGAMIEEAGIKIINCGRDSFYGSIFVESFEIDGKCDYTIKSEKQYKEFGTVTPYTWHKGFWNPEEGSIQGICSDEGNLYTGNLNWKDYKLSGKLSVKNGSQAYLIFRATGNLKYYLFGFENGKAVLKKINKSLKAEEKEEILAEKPFIPEIGKAYEMQVHCQSDVIGCFINSEEIFKVSDKSYTHGFIGYRIENGTRILIEETGIKEL